MLTISETETIRAALRYWLEEIAAHEELAQIYLDAPELVVLSPERVIALSERFERRKLRFVELEPENDRLKSRRLHSEQELHTSASPHYFATVILARPHRTDSNATHELAN